MASSVLGKRLRNENASAAISLRSSKRQAQALPQPQIHEEEDTNDENDDELSISHSTGCRSRHRRRGVTTTTTPRTLPVRNVRSKHTVPDKTIDESISPSNTAIITDENTRPHEFTTPKTPSRYRDALSHNNDNTNVKLVPVTPRRRVQVPCSGRPLTPRTPRMIASPAAAQTVYTPARQLFARSATPGRLVGRDSERQELASFIQNAVQSRQGGCMYVSGPPGTGKSAMVDEVCQDLSVGMDLKKETLRIARINCASMTNSKDIYAKLADELCEDQQLFKQSRTELLAGMFVQKKRTGSSMSTTSSALYLVALDEIDHLLTTDVETLYTLFEWSLQPYSRLVLIGIANALDLTDRFLPRLKSKNMKPLLLPFLPYTASQITGIISTRLRSLLPPSNSARTTATTVPEDFTPFLHPAAIQLCARKVASQTGDLRKAFDIVRRTIDLVEQQTRQKQTPNSPCQSPTKLPLAENVNLATSFITPPDTPSSSSASASASTTTATVYTPVTAPRATVAHVARVTASAFGQGTVQRLQGLNLQQKAALCVLVALGRRKVDNKDRGILDSPSLSSKSPRSTASSMAMGVAPPTVNELFVTYSGLCRRDKILQPLAATEFRDVISSLETLGLVGEPQVQGRGRGSASAAGGVGGGPAGLRTPSKPKTPTRMAGRVGGAGADERMLVCFVGEGEVEKLICGEGEGILRGFFRAEV
ncbi:hypothetical protein GX51_05742 [Blastomyces parvus]|uniref:Cell division control protein n=1 Tax=Blastomyces parvus TaxID=2060905 RepID=A0A2B7WVE3_9EURO|nr:hypothetical protein GX51_05742 [Blastomyces parvus]